MKAERLVFVSDVHLFFGGEEYLRVFLDFLDRVGTTATRLFIHGDLFDFYVGPKQGRLPFYDPLFASLKRLVDAGIPVTVLHGNRDYLMGRRFEDAGVEVLTDDLDVEHGGLRIHLSHGDQFCIHDHSYQFWARGVLRWAPFRWIVRTLPASLGLFVARRYRRISARKMARHAKRDLGRLPTILDGVQQFLDTHPGYDAVICGHIHWLAETPVEAGGRTVNLVTTGAWEEGPNYVLAEEGRLSLKRFEAAQPSGLSPAERA